MKRMIAAVTSATSRYFKKDTLIYVALGIIIGLLISVNSPSPVTADSDAVARGLNTLNSSLRSPNPTSALDRIADELDDLETEMRRHR